MASAIRLSLSGWAVAGVLGVAALAQAPKASEAPGNQGPTAPVSSREVGEDPVLKVPPGTRDAPLKRGQATVNCLLFVREPKGGSGAQIVRFSAVAAPQTPGSQASVAYDKFLGPLTMKSLGQVLNGTIKLHAGWPAGRVVKLAYSEQPAPVELDVASLGGVLLMDAMIRDLDLEPTFAAIGSMQEDGTVGPVEAMPDRLYAAGQYRVGRLVVPAKNAQQVADFLISQGVVAFVGTQIFTVSTVEEARPLAGKELDPDLLETMKLFGAVQRTLAGVGNRVQLLQDESLQGTLKRVLEKAPNHLSAKTLLDWGTGARTTMSMDGSIAYIDRGAAELKRALRATRQQEALGIDKQALRDNLARLKYVYERLDPKAQPYAGALYKFGDVIQRAVGMSSRPPSKLAPSLQKDFDAAREAAVAEQMKMMQGRIDAPVAGAEEVK